ncbi:MAG: cyclic nucleotide-binding domain-containing protein [Verrucomicrobia bacterium]|nr:cyclic nucleotide-binding domain-containing protein [Verrucomicrobiota bacterium]
MMILSSGIGIRWGGKKQVILLTLCLAFLTQLCAFLAHIVGAVDLLVWAGPSAVPAAVFSSGITLFILWLAFLFMELFLPRFTIMAMTALLLALVYSVLIPFLKFFPALSGLLLFVLGQVFVFGVCVRLRSALSQYVEGAQGEQVLRLLIRFEIGGALIGAALGWFFIARDRPLEVILVLSGVCFLLFLLSGWIALKGEAVSDLTLETLRAESGRYPHDLRKFAPLLLSIAFLYFMLPLIWGLLQGEVLTFFAFETSLQHIAIGTFLPLLYLAIAIIRFPCFVFFEWLTNRLGAWRSNLLYPCLVLAALVWWGLNLNSYLPPIFLFFLYIVDLHLLVARQSVAVLPEHFLRPTSLVGEWVSALGMSCGGAILFTLQGQLPSLLAVFVAISFTVVALGAGGVMGGLFRRYWQMSIKEHRWQSYGQVPTADREEIVGLLRSDDDEAQRVGLFLAAKSRHPQIYASELPQLLQRCRTEVLVTTGFELLGKCDRQFFLDQLQSQEAKVRGRALAGVAVHRIAIGLAPLTQALRDVDPWVRLLACLAAWQLGLRRLASVSWEAFHLEKIDDEALIEFIEVVRRCKTLEAISLLKKLAHYTSWQVRESAMIALGGCLATQKEGHADLLETGLKGSVHERPEIRSASVNLILASEADNSAEHIARLLNDPVDSVRDSAALGLAQLGEQGFAAAKPYLEGGEQMVAQAALLAIARMGRIGVEARKAYLLPLLQVVERSVEYPICLQEEEGIWSPVSIALRSFRQRVCSLLIEIAEVTGHHGEALAIEHLCGSLPAERRAHFLEILGRKASKSVKAALLPLLRHQGLNAPLHPPRDVELYTCHPKVLAALKELILAPDLFLAIGALMVLEEIEGALPSLPDVIKMSPLMKKALDYLSQPKRARQPREFFMNRLLFLKNVPFFQGLLLEELLRLDERMTQEQYKAGDTIFHEGDPGTRFYIVYEGKVELTRGGRFLSHVEVGGLFGEMTMFEEQPRSATAKAIAPSVFLSLDKSNFNTLVVQHPAILLQICKELARRLREMDEKFIKNNK